MKFLHQPISPFVINQRFGENNVCVDMATNRNVIICNGSNPPSGYKSLYGSLGHRGVDLRASHSQPVYCACAGTVIEIDTNPKSGLDVKVRSEINGKSYKHIYEHLLGYQPKLGQKLEVGDLIGWADNTGYSSGDHLHWEVQELRNNNWVSIDPLPYTFDSFALHVSQVKRLKEAVARLADMIADFLRRPKH